MIFLKILWAMLNNRTHFYLPFSFIHFLNDVTAIRCVFLSYVFNLNQITINKLTNNIKCSRNNTNEFGVKRTNDYLVFFHESNVFYKVENIYQRHPKVLHYVYSQDLLHSQRLRSEV